MIAFVTASPLPKELTESDLRRLGLFLGRSLRLRRKHEVGVKFVTEAAIQRLNRRYRQINRPTDVLSFQNLYSLFSIPYSSRYLGDLAICPSFARREAKRRGIPIKEELVRLLTHGVLHLRGMDHATPRAEARTFERQERVVEAALRV